MRRPSVCIVTPARAAANNGNWQTASRWARMLRNHYRVELLDRWNGESADALVALHALRSADSIASWSQGRPGSPLVVALTGTDLYRDILVDARAQRSLELADRLIVLHDRAVGDLPASYRAKAVVSLQSTAARPTLAKTARHLRVVMVGHLRQEKAPQTLFAAARMLASRHDIRIDHIGAALDPAFGVEAQALQQSCPGYRWLGALPHEATRRHIQRAHALVHTSQIEGGAHVVMEAICSGTPVLATRISGNIGMLGTGYGGCFESGDAAGLAGLLARCRDEPAILRELSEQCAARAPLFAPERESAGLLALLNTLLETTR